jgi:hypothetical protein
MLLHLNGMVLTGMTSPRAATVVQRGLGLILDSQGRREQRQPEGVAQEGLVELCRKDPTLINLIAPLLTDGQFEWLMEQIRGNQDKQA